MSDWRDISTAPMDGTEIDLWMHSNTNPEVHWRKPDCFFDRCHGHWLVWNYGPGGFYRILDLDYDATPTHWIPKPKRPVTP